jgi:hypothetical protein
MTPARAQPVKVIQHHAERQNLDLTKPLIPRIIRTNTAFFS